MCSEVSFFACFEGKTTRFGHKLFFVPQRTIHLLLYTIYDMSRDYSVFLLFVGEFCLALALASSGRLCACLCELGTRCPTTFRDRTLCGFSAEVLRKSQLEFPILGPGESRETQRMTPCQKNS